MLFVIYQCVRCFTGVNFLANKVCVYSSINNLTIDWPWDINRQVDVVLMDLCLCGIVVLVGRWCC